MGMLVSQLSLGGLGRSMPNTILLAKQIDTEKIRT